MFLFQEVVFSDNFSLLYLRISTHDVTHCIYDVVEHMGSAPARVTPVSPHDLRSGLCAVSVFVGRGAGGSAPGTMLLIDVPHIAFFAQPEFVYLQLPDLFVAVEEGIIRKNVLVDGYF